MAESPLIPEPDPNDKQSEPSLDSWKEIATYVKRDVSTVQRWERREGMPVHRHIHSKRGSVYAYSSELDAWLESRKPGLNDEPQNRTDGALQETTDETPSPWWLRTYIAPVGLSLVVLVAIAYFVVSHRIGRAAQPTIRSLAVLPLKNLSGDPSQEYIADGMTEALIGRLAGIHDLRVTSRTSVMRFKDTKLPVPEIARMLHVDALVEGAVIRQGNHVRVSAQLIWAAKDEHFWSETYDGELGDALALQSEVAQSIARRVEVTLTGEEHARLVAARHVSPEVYESYLKGRFTSSNSRADVEEAIGHFEQAIQQDPTFAPAYVGLADAYVQLGTVFLGAPPNEVRPKIIEAARKALELDPGLADAHVLLADTYQKQWRWADAETEYKRALQLNPSDAAAHLGLANWLLCQGRTHEALAWAERARDLNPLGEVGVRIGWILFHSRRYDEAIGQLRSVLAVEPDQAMARWFLGFALIASGRSQEAIHELEQTVIATGRSPGSIEMLATAYAYGGRRKEALRLVDELKQRQKTGYVPAGAFINPYLGLQDYDQAFAGFERAYQEQSNILQFLRVHPFFDPVRDDPRFIALIRRVGLN